MSFPTDSGRGVLTDEGLHLTLRAFWFLLVAFNLPNLALEAAIATLLM